MDLPRTIERLVERVEQPSALDPYAKKLSNAVGSVLGAGTAKDLLSGTPLGHPAHPMLVPVPLGCFISASVLDLSGADPRTARPLLAAGIAAAVPTAAAGLSDWSDTMGAERRVGFLHATANTVALTLYAASYVRRKRGGGRLLALAGSAVLTVGGWLGGHLSYAYGVGVDTTAFQQQPEEWTDVASAAELTPGSPIAVEYAGVPVFLLRTTEGELIALADRCTHRGGPLSEGRIVDDCVECPWHGSRFRLADGSVARGPASRPAPAYDVQELDGRIRIRKAEPRSLRTNPVGV